MDLLHRLSAFKLTNNFTNICNFQEILMHDIICLSITHKSTNEVIEIRI